MGELERLPRLIRDRAPLSRRDVLRLATVGVGSVAGISLLAACGGTASTPAPAETPTAGGGGDATSTGTATTTATTGTGGSGPDPQQMATEQVLRIANLEPQKLDPSLTTSGNEVQVVMKLFDPLLAFDRDGSAIPLCAEQWEVSDDGLTYTFAIRSGMKWTDGSPVTAGDFEYSFKRLVDPALASEYAQSAFPIKGAEEYFTGESTDASSIAITAASDAELKIELTGPAAYFLPVLATWNFMPIPKAAVDQHAEKWVEVGNIVTNGMYKLTARQHDQSLELDIYEDYWGDKPHLTKIVYVITPDPSATSVAAFENAELDVTYPVPAGDVDRIRGDAKLSPQLQTYIASGSSFILFDCSNTDSPAGNPDVRMALSLAIDRDKLVTGGLKGLYEPAPLMTPPGILGRNEAAIPKGGPEEARALLAKAGYPDGKGFPGMTLQWPQNPNFDLIGQIVQQMWKDELNIDVTLQRMEAKAHRAFFNSLSDKNIHYDAYIWGWTSDYEDPYNWYNLLWETSQDFYRIRWENAEYNKLANDAAVELDQDKRAKMYSDAEVILMREMPVIPLHYNANVFLVRSNVRDLVWGRVANERYIQKVWIAKA